MSKKFSQKKFFEVLKKRAKKYGFRLNYFGEIREKRTGMCPVVAVAAECGLRKLAKLDEEAAAVAIKLNGKFAVHVATAADTDDDYLNEKQNRTRQKLIAVTGVKPKKVKTTS